MSFRRFAIASVVVSFTLLGCGNKIPIESPTGSTESSTQASKASTDEISSKLGDESSNKSRRGHHKGWEQYISALTDSLSLSDEQVADLNELFEDYRADVEALMDSAKASGDRTGLRESLKESRHGFEDDFNDVLTEEQQTRLAEIKANAAARRKDSGWEQRIATLTDSLGLSEEQVADLNGLYEDYEADAQALIDAAKESEDRSGLIEKLDELKENFEEDFNAILTDEQQAKLDEMKSEGRKRTGNGHRHGCKGRKGR